jgi:predicted Zn-dependent peptidase
MPNGLCWERRVLLNGLTVLVYPRKSALTAQLSVAVKYGSNYDFDEKSGRAHFLEHMLAGGSQKRIEVHHQIEKMGGSSNLQTTNEYTLITVDALPEKIAESSKALSQLLFDSSFEESKLELERKVILNELVDVFDDPAERVTEELIKALFKYHPVKNSILGTKKTLNEMQLADLEQVHQKYYTPKNMVLTITGNFQNNDLETVLEDFQDNDCAPPIMNSDCTKKEGKPKKKVVIKKKGCQQTHLRCGLRTATGKDKDRPALDLINSILASGESSRLFVELREKRGLTYDLGAVNEYGLDYGFSYAGCTVGVKSLQTAQRILRCEYEKLKEEQVPREELQKSKNILIGDLFRTINDSEALPIILTEEEILFGNENALENYIRDIQAVTVEDIKQTACKYFSDENFTTAVLIPAKNRNNRQ